MKIVLMIAGAAALSMAAPAAAQMITAKDPQSVVRALQAEGYQAKLDKDKDGDPRITSATSGSEFFINFYGCTKNKDCTSIQFASGYNPDDGKGPDIDKINAWNKDQRYAKAWLAADGDFWLEFDLYTASGISADVFNNHLSIWAKQMGQFEREVGWND